MTLQGILELAGLRWKYVRTGACMGCDDEWAMLRIPLDAPSLQDLFAFLDKDGAECHAWVQNDGHIHSRMRSSLPGQS